MAQKPQGQTSQWYLNLAVSAKVPLEQKIALCVARFDSDSLLKSEMSNFHKLKISMMINFESMEWKFVLSINQSF